MLLFLSQSVAFVTLSNILTYFSLFFFSSITKLKILGSQSFLLLSFPPSHFPCSVICIWQLPHCQGWCYLLFTLCSEMVNASELRQYIESKNWNSIKSLCYYDHINTVHCRSKYCAMLIFPFLVPSAASNSGIVSFIASLNFSPVSKKYYQTYEIFFSKISPSWTRSSPTLSFFLGSLHSCILEPPFVILWGSIHYVSDPGIAHP